MSFDNYAVIDVETTGLDKTNDRVIEIAIVVMDPKFRVLRTWDSLVRPVGTVGCHVSEEVTNLTGITQEEVQAAPGFSWLIPEIADVLEGCGHWVGHNVSFDWSFLLRELAIAESHDVAWGRGAFWLGTQTICTYKEGKTLYRGTTRPRHAFSLQGACEHVGLPIAKAFMHGALVDAAMTARLLQCICRDGYLPPVSNQPCLQLKPEAQLMAADALQKQDAEGYRTAKSRFSDSFKHDLLRGLGWTLTAE